MILQLVRSVPIVERDMGFCTLLVLQEKHTFTHRLCIPPPHTLPHLWVNPDSWGPVWHCFPNLKKTFLDSVPHWDFGGYGIDVPY